MTNNEIIINQAIAHGIYTKAEAQAIVAAKGCLPIHTFAEGKKAGYSVKRGEHAAITCDLWKYTERPGKAAKAARAEAAKAGQNGPDADAPDPHYYMAKAHLFTRDQVKPAGQDDVPKAKTPEEIAAYNKKLADERKVCRVAYRAQLHGAVFTRREQRERGVLLTLHDLAPRHLWQHGSRVKFILAPAVKIPACRLGLLHRLGQRVSGAAFPGGKLLFCLRAVARGQVVQLHVHCCAFSFCSARISAAWSA